MRLLLLQSGLRYEHRKVTVLKAELLNLGIKPLLNRFPDPEGPRTEDVTATHVVVLDHLSFCDHLKENIYNIIQIMKGYE